MSPAPTVSTTSTATPGTLITPSLVTAVIPSSPRVSTTRVGPNSSKSRSFPTPKKARSSSESLTTSAIPNHFATIERYSATSPRTLGRILGSKIIGASTRLAHSKSAPQPGLIIVARLPICSALGAPLGNQPSLKAKVAVSAKSNE